MTNPAEPTIEMPGPDGQPPLPATDPASTEPAPPNTGGWRRPAVVTAVTVTLLLVGVLTAVAVARSAGKADRVGLTVAWQLRYPGNGGFATSDTERLYASWLVADLIIRAQSDGVIAYRVADGTQAWGLPVPAGKGMCTASLTAENDLAAIAYGTAKACDTVAGVDLRTGRQTFAAQIQVEEAEGRATADAPLISVDGDNVVVLSDDKTLTAFTLKDGQKRWTLAPQKSCYYRSKMAAGGGTVLINDTCSDSGQVRIVAVDSATGSVLWRTPYPRRALIMEMISAAPAVVAMTNDSGYSLVSYDAHGAKLADIPVKQGDVELLSLTTGLNAGTRGGQSRYPAAVVGTTLYASTTAARNGAAAHQLVAIDLTTGNRRWTSTGHSKAPFHLIRADQHGVIGLETGGYEIRPQLVRVSTDTGNVTVAATGAKAEPLEMPLAAADIHEAAGTVLILPLEQERNTHAIVALRRSKETA